jgi:outer membrane protein insertion porin family
LFASCHCCGPRRCRQLRLQFKFRGFKEFFIGNSAKPRLSVGIGVNWVSPFGPLRIDLAKALLKQDGDETKLFSFNVGTQF